MLNGLICVCIPRYIIFPPVIAVKCYKEGNGYVVDDLDIALFGNFPISFMEKQSSNL